MRTATFQIFIVEVGDRVLLTDRVSGLDTLYTVMRIDDGNNIGLENDSSECRQVHRDDMLWSDKDNSWTVID